MNTAIYFFGSMALFLFGVKFMGEGFESIVRYRLKNSFNRSNSSPLNYIIIGIVITILVQFSAVTTIMTVGLANSGVITLVQAFGIIMGANLGTTLKTTVYLYNPVVIVPFLSILGVFYYVFSKGKKNRDLSKLFLGLSIAILALRNVSDSVNGLKDSSVFMNFVDLYGSSWFILILAGIVFTVLFQSSSATMAIIMILVGQGVLQIDQAFMAIIGANIGTTSTTLVSSIGTGKDGKRAALMHLLFNLIGAIIIVPLSKYLINFTSSFVGGNVSLQTSFLHVGFNLITAILFIPFMNQMAKLVKLIIRDKESIVSIDKSDILDKRIINTPALADQQLISQIIKFAEVVKENVTLSIDSFINNDLSKTDEIKSNEELINYLEMNLVDFLVKLSTTEPDEKNQARFAAVHMMVADFEKIGDFALNICELTEEKIEKNVEISEDALTELRGIYSYLVESLNISIDSLRNNDKNLASTNVDIEKHIKQMNTEYRKNHIRRLNRGKCSAISGVMYLDLLSTIERIGDISSSISRSFIRDVAI